MNRRELFRSLSADDTLPKKKRSKRPPPDRPMSGIAAFTGTFTAVHAAHLLRRTTFGMSRSTVAQFAGMSLSAAVAAILAEPQSAPALPVNPSTGTTWIGQPRDSNLDGTYMRYLRSWWIGLMVSQTPSIVEKMTLFWHNFLANNYNTVGESRYLYVQNALFRQYAMGNIKDLLRDVSRDPCMLVFLNGNSNTNSSPNENYGRELLELFTIGKGPEVSMGNYTNYTEQDVQAAARVLTGWQDVNSTVTSIFTSSRHTTANKLFSSAFQNTTILGRTGTNAGIDELNDLLNMIFMQAETARYFVRKLYMWFVASDITATVEQEVIEPLADILRQNNYAVKPVLDTLFKSEHFYDPLVIGGMIKNPIDFVVGLAQRFPLPFSADPVTLETSYNALRTTVSNLEMSPFDPPGVAGWEAYYQMPNLYKLWLNSVTLPLRNDCTDRMVNSSSLNGYTFTFDVVNYLTTIVSTPGVASDVVEKCVADLFALDLTTTQKTHLTNDVFLNGQTQTAWATEWNSYVTAPNTTKYNAIRDRMRRLLRVMLRMAEFQMM